MSLNKSKIDYVDKSGELINRPGCTLNLVTGCKHYEMPEICAVGKACYARKLVCEGRLKDHPAYPHGFEPTFHPERVKKYGGAPKLIFLNNMGDVGGDWMWRFANAPDVYTSPIKMAWQMVQFARANPDHIILLLTKRPEWYGLVEWPENVWCGFSATNGAELRERWLRITDQYIGPKVRHRYWASLEPWLDDNPPRLMGATLPWLCIGGLSGPKSQSVSEATGLWLMDKSVQAKRFTKANAWKGTGLNVENGQIVFPREYPDAWRVPIVGGKTLEDERE